MFVRSTEVTSGARPTRLRPPPPGHPLLALQRGAGNAAVTRMLQRKIGFELEAGEWSSAALAGEPTPEHRRKKAIPKQGSQTKPPDARDKFYEVDGVRGTADELPGGFRDVEFVIAEREESDAGGIAAGFDTVERLYGELTDATSADDWVWPEARFGWTPPTKHTWLLDKPDKSPTHVQLQATAGIPLDQLAGTASRLVDEPERSETLAATGLHPAAADIVISTAQLVAAEALNIFETVNGAVDGAGALVGMLTLMAQFVLGGTPEHGEEDEAAFAYPKAIAAILPRTDFATLFATLPPETQKTLKQRDQPTEPTKFAELVFLMSRRTPKPGLDQPVLGFRAWKQISDAAIVPDLTRGAWADGIVAGQDRLSQSGYLQWLEQRKTQQQVTETDYAARKTEAKQLDSIGGYGDRMDKGAKGDLPLVEFRALVNQAESMSMTVPEAKAVGVRLAAYVDELVKR
jgi:hypothetical protein